MESSPGESGVDLFLAGLLLLFAFRALGTLWTISTTPRTSTGSFGAAAFLTTSIAETLEDLFEFAAVKCSVLVGITAFKQSGHVVGEFGFFEFPVLVAIQFFDQVLGIPSFTSLLSRLAWLTRASAGTATTTLSGSSGSSAGSAPSAGRATTCLLYTSDAADE